MRSSGLDRRGRRGEASSRASACSKPGLDASRLRWMVGFVVRASDVRWAAVCAVCAADAASKTAPAHMHVSVLGSGGAV
jgi:hypothetical protein